MKHTFLLLLCCWLTGSTLSAQQPHKPLNLVLQPTAALQIWSTYTMDQEVYNAATQGYDAVDDRLNFQLRRSRLGVKGTVGDNVRFDLTLAIDLVGHDLLAGTDAGANNGASPQVRLWNALVQWRLLQGSEKLNLVAGYQTPQIGRESITSAFRTPSMEKAWSQNYLRRHLVGTGPGRTVGINLGGLFVHKDRHLNWGYDVGLFNPTFNSNTGNSVGSQYAPLWTGRLACYLGDPEAEKYTTSHKINYFGQRHGLTLALAGAWQGTTDYFSHNAALGADFLWNSGHLNIDGEWTLLQRQSQGTDATPQPAFTTAVGTGHLRISYNLNLAHEHVLEPVVMVSLLDGPLTARAQTQAEQLDTFSGQEQTLTVGGNFYFNPDFKLSLQYTHRQADAGAAGAGATINNYFFQPGVGAIHRGNWLGLGLVAVL
ncbi:MAG: hypothetical protein DA408_14555 [Bacteroidetes bacterium]|nr:MAG: hypothetical protein C7N36_09930 [Bacteroidota bacterium]PTM11013.1 MAG: hypothetical protein DA408_14555 [Bacteroidota bacterium]